MNNIEKENIFMNNKVMRDGINFFVVGTFIICMLVIVLFLKNISPYINSEGVILTSIILKNIFLNSMYLLVASIILWYEVVGTIMFIRIIKKRILSAYTPKMFIYLSWLLISTLISAGMFIILVNYIPYIYLIAALLLIFLLGFRVYKGLINRYYLKIKQFEVEILDI